MMDTDKPRQRVSAKSLLGSIALTLLATVAHAQVGALKLIDKPPSFANEEVDTYEGNLRFSVEDVRIPGNGGMDLVLARNYNASSVGNPVYGQQLIDSSNAGFGMGWDLGLFPRIIGGDCQWHHAYGHRLQLELPNGQHETIYRGVSGDMSSYTKSGWKWTCPTSTATLSYLRSPEGITYEMSGLYGAYVGPAETNYNELVLPSTKATDLNGNWIAVTYSSTGGGDGRRVPTTITTSDGRTLQLAYQPFSRNISKITSGDGRMWQYEYGTEGYGTLRRVVLPNATTHQYQYHTNPSGDGYLRLRTITTPYGGTSTYEYRNDSLYRYRWSREGDSWDDYVAPGHPIYVRVSRKTTSDGAVWDYIYNPSFIQGQYDVTTVTGPAGTATRKYIGRSFSVSTPSGGPSNECGLRDAKVSRIGLLVEETIGTQYSTQLEWKELPAAGPNSSYVVWDSSISNVDNAKPACELGVFAPVLAKKTSTLDGMQYIEEHLSHDIYGNPTSIRETGPNGGSRTTTLTYYVDTTKWILRRLQNESFPGSSTSRSFDANGRLTTITRDGVTTSYSYDSQGNIATVTLPRSLVHSFSSYKRGIPQSETRPGAIGISRVVSDAGFITSETDGESHTRAYAYDGLGRVTAVTYPRGSDTSISYTTNAKTVTRGSLAETTTYDGFGRATRVSVGGIVTNFTYDSLGRKTFQSNPDGTIGTSYQYDSLNRITRITNPDTTFKVVTYGAATMTIRDERQHSTTYSYRAYGDPTQSVIMGVTAANTAANIVVTRNARDLITSVTQGGVTRSYGYDGRYYLTSETNPETGVVTYERDAAGNMTARIVGSIRTDYSYDGQNLLTGISYSDGTPAVSKTYTKTGKPRTVTSSVASRVLDYDANDNLISESLNVGGVGMTAAYSYTNLDHLASITYPVSQRVVSYAPDVLGRPTQASGYVNSVSHWSSGMVRQIEYGNGVVTNYEQNARLWPAAFLTRRNSTYYLSSSYGYDGAGNLTGIGDGVDANRNRTLGYDNLNRITSASGPWGSGSITYDGAGNITTQSLGSFSLAYAYNATNRLSSVSGSRNASYAYDTYGNVISAGGTSYSYNAAPNLTCANCGSSDRVDYGYDGSSKRVMATKAGTTTYEFYAANGDLLAEYTPALAGKLVEYIYLSGKRVAQRTSDANPPTAIAPPRSTVVANRNRGTTLAVNVGTGSAAGTVSFSSGGTVLGIAYVSNGQASIDVLDLPLGTHTITAVYSGDGTHSGNTITYQIKVVNLDWLPAVIEVLLN